MKTSQYLALTFFCFIALDQRAFATAIEPRTALSVEHRVALRLLNSRTFQIDDGKAQPISALHDALAQIKKMHGNPALTVYGATQESFGITIEILDQCRRLGLTDVKVDVPSH